MNNIKARSSNLEFQYSDPERDFDRRKVKGIVANLLKVKDQKYNMAIDTACGGKVYQDSFPKINNVTYIEVRLYIMAPYKDALMNVLIRNNRKTYGIADE